MSEGTPIIDARNLVKRFGPAGGLASRKTGGTTLAVDHVSLSVHREQTFALVGESGCGKTTIARMVLLLEGRSSGEILFHGEPIERVPRRKYRVAVQAVFQDPWSSLNPRMRVGTIVGEPLRLNTSLTSKERDHQVAETLSSVGLEPGVAVNYPHEFSGGQRQRIAIARAIILRPQAIILDEPVSALDVSVRLQIVNLLIEAQKRVGMSYLLISHDLATVRYQADVIAVMFRGAIVEKGASESVFLEPLHPYTRALFDAARFIVPGTEQASVETVEPTEAEGDLSGCRFRFRCPLAMDACSKPPQLKEVKPQHFVACHLHS